MTWQFYTKTNMTTAFARLAKGEIPTTHHKTDHQKIRITTISFFGVKPETKRE